MIPLFAILYRIRGNGLISLGSTFLGRMVFCLPFAYYMWTQIDYISGPLVEWIICTGYISFINLFVSMIGVCLFGIYTGVALPWTDELMVANKKLSERISRTLAITAIPALLLAAFGVPVLLFGLSGLGIGLIYHLCWWWNIRWFKQGPTEIAEYLTGAWLGLSALTIGIL